MALSTELKANQTANTYQYYSITFKANKKLIEITVDQDVPSYIGLYLSLEIPGSTDTFYQYPNETYNSLECDQSSLDTCVVRIDRYNLE